MNRSAIVLYGPPAAGKDTVTAALHRRSARYRYFEKLKLTVEHGDRAGYRLTTADEVTALRAQSLVLYENARYDNRYLVDRPGLDAAFAAGTIPVVHMGQVAGVRALRAYPAAWLAVALWCARDVTAQRVRLRGNPDVAARLAAWDETLDDLATATEGDFDLRIDTDQVGPDDAAKLIDAALVQHAGPGIR